MNRVVQVLFIVIALCSRGSSADDYTTWSHSQKILLNTSPTGANVPNNVYNVPVLIRLNPGNFPHFLETNLAGTDIRFAKNDGTHLPYQIESWRDHSGTDTAEIWVKVDTVLGNNADQTIVMYWGNTTTAFDSSQGNVVFDTANGFQGVWHMGESSGNAVDATVNGYHAVRSGNVAQIPGGIGFGQTFDGTDDYFTATGVTKVAFGTIFTTSGWLYIPAAVTSAGALWSQSNGDATWEPQETQFFCGNATDGASQQGRYPQVVGYSRNWINPTNALGADAWHHVTFVYRQSDSTRQIYIDGTPETPSLANYIGGTESGTTFIIGNKVSADVNNDFNGRMDELRIDNVVRSPDWVKLCYENQKIKQSLVSMGTTLTWDTSSASGTQTANGTWGTSNYWSPNETMLVGWPGSGYTARFAGSKGTYAITVTGTQTIDSLFIQTSSYTFTGGSLNFGAKSGINTGDSTATTAGSVIAGSGGLTKYGRGTLTLGGLNTYTGPTKVLCGRLSVAQPGNGAAAGNLGASAATAENLVIDSASLLFTGAAQSTDRLFSIGPHGGDTIVANGTGPLTFANTGAIAFTGSGARRLVLGGSNTGNNTVAAVIGNGTGGVTSLTKTGAGTWVLSGTSTYTGATTVFAGNFVVNGSLDSGSAVAAAAGATVSGSGNLRGAVTANGAIIIPGNTGPGTLRFGSLVLGSASRLDIELGSASDTIAVAKSLTLNGTVNIIPVAGFATGTYRIITCGGTFTNDTLNVGTTPTGRKCTIVTGAGFVNAVITTRLLQTDLRDTTLIAGQRLTYTATASGTGTLSYKWQAYPADSIGAGPTFSITSVTSAHNAKKYRCIVSDSFASDTSRWALLTVLSAPQITTQPRDTTVTSGGTVQFSCAVADTGSCTFAWRKTGSATTLRSTAVYSKSAVSTADEGDYYCIITNRAGSVNTDTVHLTIRPLPPLARCTFSPASGVAPLIVSFIDSSTGVITARSWQFGDGTSDTAKNPKHTYTTTGRFGVRLAVTGPGGTDTTDTAFVTVNVPPPVARFTITPASGTVPLEVTFKDTSGGQVTSRKWNFGDGTADTVAQPKHTYATAGLFSVTLRVTGPGGTDSLTKKDSVYAFAKGQNPLRIKGYFIGKNRVAVTITNIALIDTAPPAPWCDSIGIWIAPDTFPKLRSASTRISVYPRSSLKKAQLTDTLTLPATDSVFGLMTALYWNDGTITDFFPVNGDVVLLRDTVPFAEALQNALKLTSLTYDSMTASLRVGWCIDPLKFTGDYDVGVAYSLREPPKEMSGKQIVAVSSSCTDTVVQLAEPLRFDSLYNVALFVRKADAKEWPAPTDSARGEVRTGPPFRQIVTLFNPEVSRDTVSAFNGSIVLWKDSTFAATTINATLETYHFTPPTGFTVVGTSFMLLKTGSVPPLYIGVRINDLPAGASIRDVRLYRDSGGVVTVDYASVVDSIAGMVYVTTRDIASPFIAMVDRQTPTVTFTHQPDSVAHADRDLIDSAVITDNIANVRWFFLYGKGDEKPSVRDSGELTDTVDIRSLVISRDARAISSETGVRAWLITDDAVHRDTIDLSRNVFRPKSDEAVTGADEWHPVYPTAHLYCNDPDTFMIPRVSYQNGTYDSRYVRMFRWVATDANKTNDTNKWVEYDPADKTTRPLFSLEPGRLFWLKAKKNVQFDLGSARTLSLKDTFTIELPARQFTDFGMPFRFGVYLKDVLQASGQRADSIQFYTWKRDSVDKEYFLEPLYIAAMPDKKNEQALLQYAQGDGYSMYNPYAVPITLRIPPVPVAMSSAPGAVKKRKAGSDVPGWSTKLITQSGQGVHTTATYFGYVPGLAKSNFPLMPSFASIRIALFDRISGKYAGNYIAEDAQQGLVKELLFSNTSDSVEQVRYRFETVGAFPQSYSAYLYDVPTGKFSESGTVTLEPHSTISRWCSIGDEGWQARFSASAAMYSYGMRRLYPNPARSMVTIGYTVPSGALEQLTIAIYDLRGRRVWDHRISTLLSAGNHTITWNGVDRRHNPVGAGMYLVRLSVVGSGGVVVGRFDQRLTYMP